MLIMLIRLDQLVSSSEELLVSQLTLRVPFFSRTGAWSRRCAIECPPIHALGEILVSSSCWKLRKILEYAAPLALDDSTSTASRKCFCDEQKHGLGRQQGFVAKKKIDNAFMTGNFLFLTNPLELSIGRHFGALKWLWIPFLQKIF